MYKINIVNIGKEKVQSLSSRAFLRVSTVNTIITLLGLPDEKQQNMQIPMCSLNQHFHQVLLMNYT